MRDYCLHYHIGDRFPYWVYRKDRILNGVVLLVHKDIPHMPLTELVNTSESAWIKRFANKTHHFVASWYRPPGPVDLPNINGDTL